MTEISPTMLTENMNHTDESNNAFVLRSLPTGNSSIGDEDTELYDKTTGQISNTDSETFIIQKNKPPRHPDKSTEQIRLETFQEWPKSMKQKPAELAEAGFFYTGRGDRTMCFYCGEGLYHWDENDDPWEQHAFWYSECLYVQLKKGRDFVTKVTNLQKVCQSSSNGSVIKKEAAGSCVKLSEKCENTSKERQATEQTLCKICYTNELSIVFMPCGHLVACVDCAIVLETCAVCRKPLKGTIRVYLS